MRKHSKNSWKKRQAKKTRLATKGHLRLLEEYFKEKSMPKLDDISDTELPRALYSFYTNVRKEDGDMYKLASIKCIRASLNRHIKEKRGIDIIQDPRFIQANEMFRAVTVEMKKQGKAVTILKRVLEPSDMEIIAQHFNHNHEEEPDPRLLQQSVVFNILYFFIHHGRENLPAMQKTWFKVSVNPSNNCKFLEQVQDEMDKDRSRDLEAVYFEFG